MAATQTENLQNYVNSSEKGQPDHHLNLRNTLLQNGTEKNNVRNNSVVVAKNKASGIKNLGLEMSQYRQDGVPGSCPASDQAQNSNSGLEADLSPASDINTYPPVSDSTSVGDGSTLHAYSFPAFGSRSSYNVTEQHGHGTSTSSGNLNQNSSDVGLLQNFGQFGPQGIRHSFPTAKQPMIGPRIPGSGSVPSALTQQRFISGQSISQPTGPTPTLNQLLQSSNQIHRYQNNYGHSDQASYGQSWTSQKPITSYSPSSVSSSSSSTGYRGQTTLSTSYGGGPSPSSPSSYGQSEQQSPGGQGQGSTGQQQQASRQAWNTTSANQHSPGSRQSPQPGGQSPGTGSGSAGLPPSPQQTSPPSQSQTTQLQTQTFPSRPAQPTTPNSHAPDTRDLTGQNSNDSSGGPAPGTPNSQGMRPTPSPTGSTGSRSLSPAVASGEDPQCATPKSRKIEMSGSGHYNHPTMPQSTVPSPGAASMNSMHEEYDVSSPSWPRTPASPVFNSHVAAPDTYRSKKTDSLGKLYEMDDSPERRVWLDKLLAFMEERRTPITTCPTISKNPLDLFRLYVYVKERGGFMEVTKNKTWKDIAGMLGIGASSSAAYTLRKHYTKNLLAYECQFDRGGIDPQPIINQVEASSKKKNTKSTSVPSPGSSNSQDSFPAPGSSGTSMDGYSNFGYQPGPGSGSTSEYNASTIQRPSSQSNATSPHTGAGVTNHHAGAAAGGPSPAAGAADNVNVSNPFDDVSPSPSPRLPGGTQYAPGPHPPYGQTGPPRPQGMQQNYGNQTGYNQYSGTGPGTSSDQYQSYSGNSGYPPATRPMYPPYPPEGDNRTYTQSSNTMTTSTSSVLGAPQTAVSGTGSSSTGSSQDPYNRYNVNSNQVGNYGPSRSSYGPSGGSSSGSPSTQSPSGTYTNQQDYYRSDQAYPSQQQGSPQGSNPASQIYPNGPPNKTMPPPAPQPKRHPDFAKDQPAYAPYGPQRPQLYGWPNNNQYRGQYQPPSTVSGNSQQWPQGNSRSTCPGPQTNPCVNNQWEHRYPSNNGQGNYQPSAGVSPASAAVQQNQQWSAITTPGVGQSSPLRSPSVPRSSFRVDGKSFNINLTPNIKGNQGTSISGSSYPQQPLPKREISFPSDSIEATLPVLYRRKRICRMDIGNVDAWRIMMCLRSGLLSETTYALDALNVLLFDDSTVPYFILSQWPGLLELLLEHFRKSLADTFDCLTLHEPDQEWYVPTEENKDEIDLGTVNPDIIISNDKTVLLINTPNYTHVTRKEQVIKPVDRSEDIFITDDHKSWDVDGDATDITVYRVNSDSWGLTTIEATPNKYILSCFQSEFSNIPFHKLMSEEKCKEMLEEDAIKNEVDNDFSNNSGEFVNIIDEQFRDDEKKKRTKTLNDVISRITKDSSEINLLLTQELKEKVKTDSNGMKIDVIPEDIDLSPKTTQNGSSTKFKTKTEFDSEEDTTNGSISGSGHSNESVPMVIMNTNKLSIRDESGTLKRRRISDYEDECYTKDEASLSLITDTQDAIAKRCVCISNIFRNLTFIPGNEIEFAKNPIFLSILGKLLLLYHEHPVRTQKTRNYDREEDADFVDSCSSLQAEYEWWWEFLIQIRENVLVSLANISGHMDLSQYSEDVARPIFDGLLHWAICPSAHGQDPFPHVGVTSLLSPQRLALEALCKLCVTDANVDLVIATPPFSRLERLCAVLTKHLCRSEDQVLREFSVNLLHYLAAADSAMARIVAMQNPCVSLLVAFIEQAEQSALGVANQHGIGALRENPDSMGTSLDMLRRAAGTLLYLAKHPDNRPLFMQQEQRLLQLVMSQILDQQVAFVISRVLFHISRTSESYLSAANS